MKLFVIAALALVASSAQAQDHSTMDHSAHNASPAMAKTAPALKEAGQAAFGAIGEIVMVLRADPKTDWSKVDLERLRQHLIDMDRVTLKSQVRTTKLADGARFEVAGEDAAATSAIQRMVKAHAGTLMPSLGWESVVEPTANGANWTVKAKKANDVAMIQGLGFIGLMADGAHHQPHHLAMAKGGDPHAAHGVH